MASDMKTAAELMSATKDQQTPAEQQPQQQQQQQQQQQPTMAAARMPATLTAFTSRIGLPSSANEETHREADGSGSATDGNKEPAASALETSSTSSCSYASSSAISFYSDDDEAEADENEAQIEAENATNNNNNDGNGNDTGNDNDSEWEDESVPSSTTQLRVRQGAGFHDAKGKLIFRRVEVPRTRSLASNLSLLLRQAKVEAVQREGEELLALPSLLGSSPSSTDNSRRSSVTAVNSTDGGISSGSSAGSSGRPNMRTPFNSGTNLPNPLQCHPAFLTPPVTPTSQMSPRSPPPVPPSSPCVPTPPRSAVASAATSPSDDSPPPSSSSSSSSASSSSSSSRSSPSSPSRAYSAPVMHIAQLSGGHQFRHGSVRSTVDDNGDPLLMVPFNGGCGPRAAPIVTLGGPFQQGAHREIRSGSSLLAGEVSSSLKQHILGENSTRYIFTHYGSRRCVDDERDLDNYYSSSASSRSRFDTSGSADDAGADADAGTDAGAAAGPPPPFRRTQSAPNIQRSPPAAEDKGAGKGRAILRDAHKLDPVSEIYYINDYVEPHSWGWGMDYHSKGW